MGTLAAAQVAEHLTQAAAGSVHHTGGIPHCLNSIVRIDFHAVHKYQFPEGKRSLSVRIILPLRLIA